MIWYWSPDEDPGDPGSAGVLPDGTELAERAVNLPMAMAGHLAALRCGIDSRFDPNLTHGQRVAAANAAGAEALIACANNESTPGHSGTQFVFCPGGAAQLGQQQLADAIWARVQAAGLSSGLRPNAEDPGLDEACNFNGATAYVEAACMSPEDRPRWIDPAWRVAFGEAICAGACDHFGLPYIPPAEEDDMYTDTDRKRDEGAVAMLQQLVAQAVVKDELVELGAGRPRIWVSGPYPGQGVNLVAQDADAVVELIAYSTTGSVTGARTFQLQGNQPGISGPAAQWVQLGPAPEGLGVTGPATLGLIWHSGGDVEVTLH